MIVVLDVKIHINQDDWIISVYIHQPAYNDFIEEVIPKCKNAGVVENHEKFNRTKWKLDDAAFIELIRLRDRYNLSFSYTKNKW